MISLQGGLIRFLLRHVNLWNRPLPELREKLAAMRGKGLPAGVRHTREALGGVPCDCLTPVGAGSGTLLYFHGGGYCLGIYDTNREFAARLAEVCGVTMLLPDYRLAPEHPFPAALEDAVRVLKALAAAPGGLGQVVVAGDSSGCGLGLAALQQLKAEGAPMPAGLAAITPVYDLTGSGESLTRCAARDPFRMKDPLGLTRFYADGRDVAAPELSPLFGSLAGLPPLLIHGAADDVFLSDAQRCAAWAGKAGTEVTLKVWPGMWHLFPMQTPFVPEARLAVQELCAFVEGRLRPRRQIA